MQRIRRLDALAKMLEVEGFEELALIVKADNRASMTMMDKWVNRATDREIANDVKDAVLYGAGIIRIERTQP